MAYTGSALAGQNLQSITNGFTFKDKEGIIINSSTGTYSMSSTQQKSVIVHTAAGTATYELPGASAGKVFRFIHKGDVPSSTAFNQVRIKPASGDQISFSSFLAINPGYLQLNLKGTQVELIAIDSTTWQVVSFTLNDLQKNQTLIDTQSDFSLVSKDTWVSKAALATNRAGSCSASLKGYLYTLKGGTGNPVINEYNAQYDDVADIWTTKTNTGSGTARTTPIGVSLNDFIYVCGGYANDSATTYALVNQYNDVANTWASKTNMNVTRWRAAGQNLNGFMYASHGASGNSGVYVNSSEKYNDNANTWTNTASSGVNGEGSSSFILAGYFYVTGGYNGAYTNTTIQYNDSSNAWINRATSGTARFGAVNFSINMKGYSGGGDDGGNSTEVTEYESVTNAWTTKSAQPTSIRIAGSCSLHGYGYGTAGSAIGTSHYQYN